MSERGVQVIDRALDIIELLSSNKNGFGITEISKELDLNKSTVHRIAKALTKRGYLEKFTTNNNYKIGLKFIEISGILLNDLELKTEAHAYLSSLSSKTNQPVHLGILDGFDTVYIDKVDSVSNLRLYSEIGKRISVHCSALGKTLLSNMSKKNLENYLEGLNFEIFTKNTLKNKKELIEEILNAKKTGYAIDNEEHEEEIICIASPIYDYRKELIASISITGDKKNMIENKMEIIQSVKNCAEEISKRMGYTF